MHPFIKSLTEDKLDDIVNDLEKTMNKRNKQKQISAETLLSFKELKTKLSKIIANSEKTLGA